MGLWFGDYPKWIKWIKISIFLLTKIEKVDIIITNNKKSIQKINKKGSMMDAEGENF